MKAKPNYLKYIGFNALEPEAFIDMVLVIRLGKFTLLPFDLLLDREDVQTTVKDILVDIYSGKYTNKEMSERHGMPTSVIVKVFSFIFDKRVWTV